MTKIRLFTLLICLSCNAFAGLSIRDFEDKNKVQSTNSYIKGLSSGLNTMNRELAAGDTVPLFCLPPYLNLTTANYREIIALGVKELAPNVIPRPDIDQILLNQLITLYPCGYN
jgi:hypothetical protein